MGGLEDNQQHQPIMQEGNVNLNQEEVSQLQESLTQPEAVALNQVSGENIKSEIHRQVRK
jgi:predicted site-specific integrase-resolvase